MKIWYRAVCDEHREMCQIFVNNPTCSAHYLADKDEQIQAWLEAHFFCDLRLVHRDEDLDKLLGTYSEPT